MSVEVNYVARHMSSQMRTIDPQNLDLPALTTLLYKVCDGNNDKFKEACRLLNLFMDKAVQGVKHV